MVNQKIAKNLNKKLGFIKALTVEIALKEISSYLKVYI
jgi:hypothetical protein